MGYALSVALFAAAVGAQAISGTEGIRGGKGDEAKRNRRESVVRFFLVIGLYLAITFIPFSDRREIAVIAGEPRCAGRGSPFARWDTA